MGIQGTLYIIIYLFLTVAFLVTPWNRVASRLTFMQNTTAEDRYEMFNRETTAIIEKWEAPFNIFTNQSVAFYNAATQFLNIHYMMLDTDVRLVVCRWSQVIQDEYYKGRALMDREVAVLVYGTEQASRMFTREEMKRATPLIDMLDIQSVLDGNWFYTHQFINGTLHGVDIVLFVYARYLHAYAWGLTVLFYILTDEVVLDMFVINIAMFLLMSLTKELVFQLSRIMFLGNLRYWVYSKYYDILVSYGFLDMVMNCITLFLCCRIFLILSGLPWLLNFSGFYLIALSFLFGLITMFHNFKSEIKYKVELKIDATIKLVKVQNKPKVNIMVNIMCGILKAIWDFQPFIVRLHRTFGGFRPLFLLRAPNMISYIIYWPSAIIMMTLWLPIDIVYYSLGWVVAYGWVLPYINNREVSEDKWAEITNAARDTYVMVMGYPVYEHDGYLYNYLRTWAFILGWKDQRYPPTHQYSSFRAFLQDFKDAYPRTRLGWCKHCCEDTETTCCIFNACRDGSCCKDCCGEDGDPNPPPNPNKIFSILGTDSDQDEEDSNDYTLKDEEGADALMEDLRQRGRDYGDRSDEPQISGHAGKLLTDPALRELKRRELHAYLERVYQVPYTKYEPTFETSEKIKKLMKKKEVIHPMLVEPTILDDSKPGVIKLPSSIKLEQLKPFKYNIVYDIAYQQTDITLDPKKFADILTISCKPNLLGEMKEFVDNKVHLLAADTADELLLKLVTLREYQLFMNADIVVDQTYVERPKVDLPNVKKFSEQLIAEIFTQGELLSGQPLRFLTDLTRSLTARAILLNFLEGGLSSEEKYYRVILSDTYIRLIDEEVQVNKKVESLIEVILPPPGFEDKSALIVKPSQVETFKLKLKQPGEPIVVPKRVMSYLEYEYGKEYRLAVKKFTKIQPYNFDVFTTVWIVDTFCTADSSQLKEVSNCRDMIRWLSNLKETITIPATTYLLGKACLTDDTMRFILERLGRNKPDAEGVQRYLLDTKVNEIRRKRVTYFLKLNDSYLRRFLTESEMVSILKELKVKEMRDVDIHPGSQLFKPKQVGSAQDELAEFHYLNSQRFVFRKASTQPKGIGLEFLGVQDKYDMPASYTYWNTEMEQLVLRIDPSAPTRDYQPVKPDRDLIEESIKKYEAKQLRFNLEEEYHGTKIIDYLVKSLDLLFKTNDEFRVRVPSIKEFSIDDLSHSSRKTFPGFQCRETYGIQHKSSNIELAKSLAEEYRSYVLRGVPMEHIWDLIPIPKASKAGSPEIRTVLAPEYYFYINQFCIFKGLKEIVSTSDHSQDFSCFFGHFDKVCRRFPSHHIKENLDLKNQGGSVPNVFSKVLYRWYSRFLENDQDRMMLKHCIDNIFKATFMIPKSLGGGVFHKENGWGDGPFGTNQVDAFFMACYYIVNVWDNCVTLSIPLDYLWKIVLELHGDNWLHSYEPTDGHIYRWNGSTLHRLGQKVKGAIVQTVDIKECELMGFMITESNGLFVGRRPYAKTVKSLVINRRKPTDTETQRSYEAGLINSLFLVDCWDAQAYRLLNSLHAKYSSIQPATTEVETKQRIMILQHVNFDPKEAWKHSKPVQFDEEKDILSF